MSTRNCQRCGATYTPTQSPHGLCPRCLLDVGMRGPDELEPERPRRAPELAAIAPLFPELELVAPIGEGGMGFVYRARQRELGRDVALKLLAREHADTPSFAERFRREARTLARLSHTGIVAIFDSGERGGWFYLLMEYVDGANLRHLMQSAAIESKQALSIVSQVCAALQYSHDQGVVHRDVKPENVLVDREGRVKIVDFGLARLLAGDRGAFALTGSHQVMGTPHYMAPEQWEKPQAVDHRADIYALGVVFYELLTGEMPLGRFDAPSKRVEVDVRLDDVVLKALEKQPERRYQHASEVQVDVDSIAGSAGRDRAQRAPVPSPSLATVAWFALSALGIAFVCSGAALWQVARVHFAANVETRNGWWGAALGVVVGGLLAGVTAALRLARREDYELAFKTRALNWIDGAWALLASVGGVGLVCAALSKQNHPATETVWLASCMLLLVSSTMWLMRQAAAWRAERRSRQHAHGVAGARPSSAHALSESKLVLFSLVLFIGFFLFTSAISMVVTQLVVTAQPLALGWKVIGFPVALQSTLGLPCIATGWHLLELSSPTSGAWSRPRWGAFDLVIALYAVVALVYLSSLPELPRGSQPFWSVLTYAGTGALVAAWFAWTRWSRRRLALRPA